MNAHTPMAAITRDMLLEAIKENAPQMSLMQSMHGERTTAERVATNVTSAEARHWLWLAMHHAIGGRSTLVVQYLREFCEAQATDYAEGFE